MVTQFKVDKKLPVADVKDAKELHKALDGILPNPGSTCAFRIDGTFKYLKVRSVPSRKSLIRTWKRLSSIRRCLS